MRVPIGAPGGGVWGWVPIGGGGWCLVENEGAWEGCPVENEGTWEGGGVGTGKGTGKSTRTRSVKNRPLATYPVVSPQATPYHLNERPRTQPMRAHPKADSG